MVKKNSVKVKSDTASDFIKFVASGRKWKLLVDFCRGQQKLCLSDVECLLRIYKKIQQDESNSEVARRVEDLFLHANIIPVGIRGAGDVRGWNHSLRYFLQLSKNEIAKDEDKVLDFTYDWWRSAMNAHFAEGNVFNVVSRSTIVTAESWRDVFPVKRLVQDERFGLLLHCGEIEALLAAGQSSMLISFLNKFDLATVTAPHIRSIIYRWAAQIPTEEMRQYLRIETILTDELKDFRIFAWHPKGLDCLVAEGCFGKIALMGDAFKTIANDYPQEFEKVQPKERYVATLSYGLDEII